MITHFSRNSCFLWKEPLCVSIYSSERVAHNQWFQWSSGDDYGAPWYVDYNKGWCIDLRQYISPDFLILKPPPLSATFPQRYVWTINWQIQWCWLDRILIYFMALHISHFSYSNCTYIIHYPLDVSSPDR